jgi:SAM-dependent methyltransferase
MGAKATEQPGELACGLMTEPAWQDRRLSFGETAAAYDRYRPGYPSQAAAWLVAVPAPARVLDLGAGTGRLAGVLAALGHEVLAVEPDEGMRAVAEARLPGRTAAGTAERIPAPDRSFDAVVAAQAFHWFDPDRALPEIARVLRPGGRIGVIWNVRDDSGGWSAQLSELVGGQDRRAAEGRGRAPAFGPLFGPAQSLVLDHEQELDAEHLVGLASSWSYVALRADREEVLAQVRAIATGHPDLAGRERFALRYSTRAFRARRLPVQGPGAGWPADGSGS